MTSEITTTTLEQRVERVHDMCKHAVEEFVADVREGDPRSLRMSVWFNLISSIVDVVQRTTSATEREQEKMIYTVLRRVLREDVPGLDEKTRAVVLDVFESVAPTIIDMIVVGEHVDPFESAVRRYLCCCCPFSSSTSKE